MTKRVLVLGATGRTGRHVVDQALAAGWSVNALARRPEALSLSDPNLTVFKGTPEELSDLDAAMAGCVGVIATLNNARVSDSPFAKIVQSPTLLTDCFNNIIPSMKRHGVRRIVQLGAAGAGNSFQTVPWIFKQLIKRTNLGVAYRDHEGVEAALARSGLDWTVARAVGLGTKTGTVIESYVANGKSSPKPSMQIGRECVAKWMVEALDRRDLYEKAPIVSLG